MTLLTCVDLRLDVPFSEAFGDIVPPIGVHKKHVIIIIVITIILGIFERIVSSMSRCSE